VRGGENDTCQPPADRTDPTLPDSYFPSAHPQRRRIVCSARLADNGGRGRPYALARPVAACGNSHAALMPGTRPVAERHVRQQQALERLHSADR
jgi:hypothetical protein